MYRLLSAILLCAILIVSSDSKPKRNKDFTHSSRKEFCDALSGEWKSVKSNATIGFLLPLGAAMDSGMVDVNVTGDPLDITYQSFQLQDRKDPSDSLVTNWFLFFILKNYEGYTALIVKLNKDTLQIYDQEHYLHGTYLRKKK
jgi:hypothetical protein